MSLNIEDEVLKVRTIVGDQYNIGPYVPRDGLNFLFYVLKMTKNYPQLETYLEELLKNFTIKELEVLNSRGTILHLMMENFTKISLNSFEIIIKFGVNVNIQNPSGRTVLHLLYFNMFFDDYYDYYNYYHGWNDYDKISYDDIYNITNLLIKYGADLNILTIFDETILDMTTSITYLNKNNKDCIIYLLDNGAKLNNPKQRNTSTMNFIESCRCDKIKPAIKN